MAEGYNPLVGHGINIAELEGGNSGECLEELISFTQEKNININLALPKKS
jgi:hypothetical protein